MSEFVLSMGGLFDLKTVQLFVVFAALTATVFPLACSVVLVRMFKGIGGVLTFFLIAEAINMAVAGYFAYNSYIGVYNEMAPYDSAALRMVIISTAFLSTGKFVYYLFYRRHRLILALREAA